MSGPNDFFDGSDASRKEIKGAYFKLASKYHPYKTPSRINQWRLIEKVSREPRDPEKLFKKYLRFDREYLMGFGQEYLYLMEFDQKSFFNYIRLSLSKPSDQIKKWKETIQGHFSENSPLKEACERISECFSVDLINESKGRKPLDCAAAFILWVVMNDKPEFLLNRSFMSIFDKTVFDDAMFDETIFDEVMRDEFVFDETVFDEIMFDEAVSSFNKPYEDIQGAPTELTIVIAVIFGSEKIISKGFQLGLFTASDLGVALSIAIIQDNQDNSELFNRLISVAKKNGILVSSIKLTDTNFCRDPLVVALFFKREDYALTLINEHINLSACPSGRNYFNLAVESRMGPNLVGLLLDKMTISKKEIKQAVESKYLHHFYHPGTLNLLEQRLQILEVKTTQYSNGLNQVHGLRASCFLNGIAQSNEIHTPVNLNGFSMN